MRAKIEKFLERYPKDATSWADATDEIRDMSRESREILEDCDGIAVEAVNFKAIRTPAEWNTKGRESILANFDRMSEYTKRDFYASFRDWFEPAEPNEPKEPWAMKLVDGTILFFDTNEEMVAYSVKPEVNYQTMGKREYIAN